MVSHAPSKIPRTPESEAGFLSRIAFCWVWPLLAHNRTREKVELDDLLPLPTEFDPTMLKREVKTAREKRGM